jgi:hypothetical protein
MSLAAVLVVLGCLWLAGEASAHVYWGSLNGNRVGRASPDGSEVEPNLITGASEPWGVAVDGTHLYWANETGNTIGRANLDGSEVEADFIEAAEPTALAVSEGHIYWIDPGPRSIGRAKLDGTEVEDEFIANVGAFAGLAANSQFIYWGDPSGSGSIGRARLDGSGVEEAFIDPAGSLVPYGVAIDANHVYWANAANDSIGRADLDGGAIEEAFIANAHPAGVAVDADYVYWGKASPPEAIGRANLDGSDIQSAFVPGAEEAFGLATDVAPATLSTVAAVSIGAGTIHGTAILGGANAPTGTISFDLFGPGDENCTGAPLATSTASVSGNGSYESAKFRPTQVGTYRWKAAYSGDLENNPLNGACGGTLEVTPAPAAGTAPAPTPVALTITTPSSSLNIVRRKHDRRAGEAKVTADVSGPGELTLSGKHIEKVTRHVSEAGTAQLTVSPTGALARSLKRQRTARVTVRIGFTPSGGAAIVRHLRMRLAQHSRPTR